MVREGWHREASPYPDLRPFSATQPSRRERLFLPLSSHSWRKAKLMVRLRCVLSRRPRPSDRPRYRTEAAACGRSTNLHPTPAILGTAAEDRFRAGRAVPRVRLTSRFGASAVRDRLLGQVLMLDHPGPSRGLTPRVVDGSEISSSRVCGNDRAIAAPSLRRGLPSQYRADDDHAPLANGMGQPRAAPRLQAHRVRASSCSSEIHNTL